MNQKNKNGILVYSLYSTILLLSIIHLVVFTFLYQQQKNIIITNARAQAIHSNDLIGFLVDREQTNLDIILKDPRTKENNYNFSWVSQYESAYTISKNDTASVTLFGQPLNNKEFLSLQEKIYRKWLTQKDFPNKNIFITYDGKGYIGKDISDSSSIENHFLVIKMKKPHLQQILNIPIENFTRETFIFDDENQLLSSNGSLSDFSNEFIKKNNYSEKLKGNNYYIVITNTIHRWKTLLIFKNIFKTLVIKTFFSSFFITIPLGMFIFFLLRVFSFKFYTPFKNLINFLEEKIEGDPNKNIQILMDTKKSYENNLPKLKERFLIDVLRNSQPFSKDIFNEYNFKFKDKKYFIIAIFSNEFLLEEEYNIFFNRWVNNVDITNDGRKIIIFSGDSLEKVKEIPTTFESFNNKGIVSFSNTLNNISKLSTAYREASFCWSSSIRSESNIVTPIKLKVRTNETLDISFIKKKLLNNIKTGKDYESELDEIMTTIFSSTQSVMTLKMIFLRLLSSIINLDDTLFFDQLSREEIFFKFEKLNTPLNVRTFFKEIIKYVEINLFKKKKNLDFQVVKKVEIYIQQNHKNIDFTISSLASNLGFSISLLERKFKNIHSLSIKEYLIQTRIRSAKTLLKDDFSLKIKDLALLVGYENSRSFINIFKKYVGVTPGEYKKKVVSEP